MIIDLHKAAGFSFDPDEGETGFFESEALQGDPYFWDHLNKLAENMDVITPDELEEWIKAEYLSVSGKPLTDEYGDFAVVEEFAHGGMSSGGVDNLWWLEKGIPLLKRRLTALR